MTTAATFTLVEVVPVSHPLQAFVAYVAVASTKTGRFTKAPSIAAYFNTAEEAIEGAKRIAAGVKVRKGQRTFWHVNTSTRSFLDSFVANSNGDLML